MKYYSETLKKLFSTEAELKQAEKRDAELAKKAEEQKTAIANAKKSAATKVQLAIEAYDKAVEQFEADKKKISKDLDVAQTEAATILATAHEKASKDLKTARDKLNASKMDKLAAISEFNKSYGPYKTSITEEAAEKELNRFFDTFADVDMWIKNLNKFL